MAKRVFVSFLLVVLLIISGFIGNAVAQFQTPRPSPKASLSQTVGLTDVSITYNRPGVKGRVIWGELVPYNQVWRTGANEATIFSISDDVMVEGQKLPKGNYSLHTLPTATEWTIIFNKVANQWGSYNYNEAEDALRVKVKPMASSHVERMQFTFDDVTDSTANIVLAWEKVKVPVTLKVNTTAKVIGAAKTTYGWRGLYNAAQYAMQNNINLMDAMKWADASIALEENFQNLALKANLLSKLGKPRDAATIGEKAVKLGKTMERVPANLGDFEKQVAEWKKMK